MWTFNGASQTSPGKRQGRILKLCWGNSIYEEKTEFTNIPLKCTTLSIN